MKPPISHFFEIGVHRGGTSTQTSGNTMKQIYKHPTLESFSQNEREEIWHAFRTKNPNWIWSLTFLGLWLRWFIAWMIAAPYLREKFVEGLISMIAFHLVLTPIIAFLGLMMIGKVMLPRRMKEFHRFLDGRDRIALLSELELEHLKSDTYEQAAGGDTEDLRWRASAISMASEEVVAIRYDEGHVQVVAI